MKSSRLQRMAMFALYICFLVSSCCISLASAKGSQKGITLSEKILKPPGGKVQEKRKRSSEPVKRSPVARSNGGRGKLLKPKLVPHPDDVYLLEFHTDNNDHCEQMEPVVQRLEDDLQTKVKRINIFHRKEFMYLLESIGFDEGGQLPFYYNRRTGQAVTGATTYANLRKWGTGQIGAMFNDPPQTLQQTEEENSFSKRKDIGNTGGLMEKIMDFGSKGKKKAEENTKAAEKGSTTASDDASESSAKSMKAKTKTKSKKADKASSINTASQTQTQQQVASTPAAASSSMSTAAQRTAARRAKRTVKSKKRE